MIEQDEYGKRIYTITETNRKHVFTEMYQTVPVGYKITVQPPSRTLDQNAKLWPMLQDVSRQVDWYGIKLTDDEWKDVFTASLKKSKVVPGLDGGFVTCGLHTSRLSKADFSDLIELIYAFGAQKSVVWSEKSVKAYEEWLAEVASRSPRREIDITPQKEQLPYNLNNKDGTHGEAVQRLEDHRRGPGSRNR